MRIGDGDITTDKMKLSDLIDLYKDKTFDENPNNNTIIRVYDKDTHKLILFVYNGENDYKLDSKEDIPMDNLNVDVDSVGITYDVRIIVNVDGR